MYQKILVVLDAESDEQKALSRALHLARIVPVELTLFVSIYDFSYEMTTMLSGEEREQMRHSLIQDRRHWVNSILDDFETDGLNLKLEVVWHHRPFEAIIRCALDHGHDLIIKGAKKHGTLQSVIFTPTDWHLLRKAPCQVLLVKEHAWPEQQGQILAAVHAAAESDTHQALNKKVIESANEMSRKLKARLHLINCYPSAPSAIAIEIPEFDSYQYQTSVKSFHEEELNKLVTATAATIFQTHLVEGMPEDAIPKLADEIDAGLVVLGTIGRTGISAALLGNTAEHVIGQLNCDLLALKPDGFKCPFE